MLQITEIVRIECVNIYKSWLFTHLKDTYHHTCALGRGTMICFPYVICLKNDQIVSDFLRKETTILVKEMQTDLIFELGYLGYLLTVLPSVKIFRPAIVSTELNREEKSQTIYLPLGARERIHSLWGARKTWWGSRPTFNPPLLWNSFDCNWRDRYQSTAGMQEMNLTTFWRLCNMMP